MWNGLILSKENKEPRKGFISKVKQEPCRIKGQTDGTIQIRWDRNEVMYMETTELNVWFEAADGKLYMVLILDE